MLSGEFEKDADKSKILYERLQEHIREHKTYMKLTEESVGEKQI